MDLQSAAAEHLWLHFSHMKRAGELPIIVSGDGCYLTDERGKTYLDALAGLFAVQIGYGFGEEVGWRRFALPQLGQPARDASMGKLPHRGFSPCPCG